MALLMEDDIFKCENCAYPEFIIQNIKSFTYIKNDKNVAILRPNTGRQALVCSNCKQEVQVDYRFENGEAD